MLASGVNLMSASLGEGRENRKNLNQMVGRGLNWYHFITVRTNSCAWNFKHDVKQRQEMICIPFVDPHYGGRTKQDVI